MVQQRPAAAVSGPAQHPEQPDAAAGQLDRAGRHDGRLRRRRRWRTRWTAPARSRRPTAAPGSCTVDRLRAGVQLHQVGVVDDRPAVLVAVPDARGRRGTCRGSAGRCRTSRRSVSSRRPGRTRPGRGCRRPPGADLVALEERLLAQHRGAAAQRTSRRDEGRAGPCVDVLPVEPGDLVVLAVGVVVAAAGCGRARRRRSASARRSTAAAWPAGCAPAAPAAPAPPGRRSAPSTPQFQERLSLVAVPVVLAVGLVVLAARR